MGKEKEGTVLKTKNIDETWAVQIKNKYYNIFGAEIVWQSVLDRIENQDLVIVEQADRLLVNKLLIWKKRLFEKYKIAYWGTEGIFKKNRIRDFLKKKGLNKSIGG